MNKKVLYGIIAVVVLALIGFFFMGGKKAPQTSFATAKVAKGEVSTTITATGTIEPVTEVEVGTQVSGIIDKIYVDYNSVVKKGQVIAEMDRKNLVSELTTAQSNLASAKSSLDYQKAYYERYKTLYDKGLISTNDYQNAQLNYVQAQETYRSRQESVKTAQQNLAYATITSPIDGVILDKAVEEGQTVAAGFSTPTLFTIAQDLKLKPGLTANVTIYTQEKKDILVMPNKALKFTPTQMMAGKDGKINDVQAQKKVWTKEGNTFTAHEVKTGITNGTLTEVLGGVSEGTVVITEVQIDGGAEEAEESNSNPFMPGPPGSRNNNKSSDK